MNTSEFSKSELVTIAVAFLSGEKAYVDREDVALKVNDIAPGRFNWRKYPDRIDLDAVGCALRGAKKIQKRRIVSWEQYKWMDAKSGRLKVDKNRRF